MKKLLRALVDRPRRATAYITGLISGSPCLICGRCSTRKRIAVITDELAHAWELTPEWRAHFEDREGVICALCRGNRRSEQHAAAIMRWVSERVGRTFQSFAQMTASSDFHALEVAEINSCGQLHRFLARHPSLAYSEYKGCPPTRSEDLMALSYPDNYFDLVLTSESLEHVPDPLRALRETARILKPGGAHIFTTPVIWDRPRTHCCARLEPDGSISHFKSPSFHGLPGESAQDMMVFSEFGADFPEIVARANFRLEVWKDYTNPALSVFTAIKLG